jgi:hypothetical protein
MCRMGAYELSKTIEELNKEYDNKIRCVAVGVMEDGYEEFITNFFPIYPTYININMTIYKALKYNKPGFLKCFGLCVKGVVKKLNDAEEKLKTYNLKDNIGYKITKNMLQLGGAFLLNNQADILYCHIDNYVGDHPSSDEIKEAINNYFDRD